MKNDKAITALVEKIESECRDFEHNRIHNQDAEKEKNIEAILEFAEAIKTLKK